MLRHLTLLKNRRKLVFLSFTDVDPQALTWYFLLNVIDIPNAE
jgi:hypothetical protein